MGRAIRHANDFAALIFMDSRYERTSNSSPNEVVSNLPEWMVRSLKTVHTVEFPTIFQRFFNPLMLEFNKEKHTAH
jgi:Rad3-related DNA helicase